MTNKIKLYIQIFFMFSFSWCIGLKGLIIPENGYVLSTNGTGIAEGNSPSLNPALRENSTSYIQFSFNHWIGDIQGSHIAYHFGEKFAQSITIQTWNATDLELRDDTPTQIPLGTFGVHYVSTAYSISHDLNTPFRFGMRLQSNYNNLFIESESNLMLSGGALFPINSFITIGTVIKNLTFEKKSDLDPTLGIGMQIKIPFNLSFSSDFIKISELDEDIRFGFRTNWNKINFHMGSSMSENRNSKAFGFSFNHKRWLINYGIYYHENSTLSPSLPQFFDIRFHL